jgi:hypothetical protein
MPWPEPSPSPVFRWASRHCRTPSPIVPARVNSGGADDRRSCYFFGGMGGSVDGVDVRRTCAGDKAARAEWRRYLEAGGTDDLRTWGALNLRLPDGVAWAEVRPYAKIHLSHPEVSSHERLDYLPDPAAVLLAPRRDVSPEAELAAAVIRQALADAAGAAAGGPRTPLAIPRFEFLEGADGWLRFWADVAGLRVDTVQELTRRALAAGRRGRVAHPVARRAAGPYRPRHPRHDAAPCVIRTPSSEIQSASERRCGTTLSRTR